MKKLLFAVVVLGLSTGFAKTDKKESTVKSKEQRSISSVNGRPFAVCAAEMNSPSLGNLNHDLTSIGTLYIVDASDSNDKEVLTNSLYCISKADKMKVIVSRLSDVANDTESSEKRQMLIDAIDGKFFGKKVRIILDRDYFTKTDEAATLSVRQIRVID